MTWTLLIHGGAGAMRGPLADGGARERAALRDALAAGSAVLAAGGRALDAAQAAVASLEASAVFNAGRGAVHARDGQCWLDAALMDGRTRRAGAVCAVRGIASAIGLARLVMERTPHVLLAGAGAEAFADVCGAARVAPDWFRPSEDSQGTVGAVARDAAGDYAAATSTGGVHGKLPGRVGDSPQLGAGTWAGARFALSATGHGESFIRAAFAHRVAVEVAAGRSLARACADALADVGSLGGDGGCIALADDLAAAPCSTAGMARGLARADGLVAVALAAGEPFPA